jgi:hypothetical protein
MSSNARVRILTVHYREQGWLDRQSSSFNKSSAGVTFYRSLSAGLEIPPGAPDDSEARDFEATSLKHGPQLDFLASKAIEDGNPADVILVLDSDSILLRGWLDFVMEALQSSRAIVVHRLENRGDNFPHPCFFAMKLRDYSALNLLWAEYTPWTNESGDLTHAVGTGVGRKLGESSSGRDLILTKSNRHVLKANPALFSIYGDIVYHHGAGSRRPITRELRYINDRWGVFPNVPRYWRVKFDVVRKGMARLRFRYVMGQAAVLSRKILSSIDDGVGELDLVGLKSVLDKHGPKRKAED